MLNDELLLNSLQNFYENDIFAENLIAILKDEKKISLRSIDWFITNYSKKNKIYYNIYKTESGEVTLDRKDNKHRNGTNVFQSYKSQLKAYSKKKFDPFCRRDRIEFKCKDTILETTIGQLNFFKWAINNLIIDYIFQHKKEIENDMNHSLKDIKKQGKTRKKGERKMRQELSLSATRGLSRTNIYVKLEFD